MQRDGLGILYQQYLDLKDKLQKEGLFDESRKLPLPEYPERVAVITAPTGEAIHDIISTFNRRLPLAKLKLYPALVQGVDAPSDLIRALTLVLNEQWAEVLIIGRGGGSFEDLSCFNDEKLVRMLADFPIPVVSAVGHEGDYTICDFVSSYRAPTPTGAAMRLTKDKMQVIQYIEDKMSRLTITIKNSLIQKFNQYQTCKSAYVLAHFDEYINQMAYPYVISNEKLNAFQPMKLMEQWKRSTDDLTHRLYASGVNIWENKKMLFQSIDNRFTPKLYESNINKWENIVNQFIEKSILLNPFHVMEKGYAILKQEDKIIKSVQEMKVDVPLQIKMHDGIVVAHIDEIEKRVRYKEEKLMEEKKFEQLLAELQEVVAKLESGKLSLEESVEAYQKGMTLSLECKKKLEEAKSVIVNKVTPTGEEKFENN